MCKLDGGVDFNNSTKIAHRHAGGVLNFCMQMFGFRKYNILRMKMGYFRKTCLINCDCVTLKMGVPISDGPSCSFLWENFVNDLTDFSK